MTMFDVGVRSARWWIGGRRRLLAVCAVAALVALAGAGQASAHPAPKDNGIQYFGGPVMLGTVPVYYIWYGNWSGNDAPRLLTDLIYGLSGSSYMNINTTYYNRAKQPVSGTFTFAGAVDDNYSQGTALSDAQVQAIVAAQCGSLGNCDPNAVYFVLTSADVNETSGFGTQYCSFHTNATIAGKDIKYAFVGDTSRAPSACEDQVIGPNGSGGADGMANQIAAELDATTTDPDHNAWYTGVKGSKAVGPENAIKCAWTFGNFLYTTANGAQANINIAGHDYLIQQNWVNARGGYCAMSYPF
jgi:hypothetical protein